MNYGGIDSHSSLADAKFVVVPVPYDLTSTYQSGSRRGPDAILDASANMELYDEELRKETYLAGIHTLVPLAADARGPGEMVASVREQITRVLVHGKIPVMLGGEHSISLGAVQAMQEKYPALSVLQLDAHADLRDSYQGSPYSHAAVARRIAEVCPLVQVGIRSISAEEWEWAKRTGQISRIHWADKLELVDTIENQLSKNVYLTIDVDIFDPSVIPATGTPEPGGMFWFEVIDILKGVCTTKNIVGIDIVELLPRPGDIASDFTIAKLIYKTLGFLTLK